MQGALGVHPLAPTARFRWNWLIDRRRDAIWYIGSALAGWLYIGLVLWLGRGLTSPLNDTLAVVAVGDFRLPLTLDLLVVASWAFLVDAPHVFATLARTFLDPDEWRVRRRVLLLSWVFFLVGPAAVLLPYAVGVFVPLSPAALALGGPLFLIFFRLWAYYHVVRQHWGFLVLYKRRNQDFEDPLENRTDSAFFHLMLYLPLGMFLAAPWYASVGFPPTGLQHPIAGGFAISDVLGPLCWMLYPAALLGYVGFQLWRWRRGLPRNGPKLLFLASIVPLHLAVFTHPLLALFVVPIVTVGHNLQYHRIVWAYGKRKYAQGSSTAHRWVRPLFKSVVLYAVGGMAFTLLLYRGPWIDAVKARIGGTVDGFLGDTLSRIAGAADLGVGAAVAGWLITGWAMQHYYLDSKIWRVSRDAQVARTLDV